ncbi:precorrin-2 C20-methyltransferase /cobalt-factor II C20-methyltransferase [Geoalkalibacter ferrihydriticus]|uniref:Precorrin-2 C20-methyltransferase n=2 Tax=Geoalkalibacter ferrihydriticus TaxID=392333 RepID=A0A0C2HU40_9BACT|nr:precorrin-2 C(20)-methyltransferase [Geoalkalibacter ferrihydriticus]KIH76337.1 precorrin-2 C20-methyltransferase [Geoalkalibacter ferrihydriticus DSM 17813]SDL19823.1 precorrin-2 C20-methyltransferase /cobalt-factor II C20-methyltransferase [Geoalkalibacter ferrihydriticus]
MSLQVLAIVGVGPGDPELVTLKAARLIQEADVVIAPLGDRSDASIAEGIIAGLVDAPRQQVIRQVYPMSKNPADMQEFWRDAARQAAHLVRSGKKVVFITLGDPLLYSTALYLARQLRDEAPEIGVEFVSGVSSINAAAARAGLPLALADERLAVLPATFEGDKLRRALEDFDTVVLMKVHRVFERVRALLTEMGLLESAVYLRRIGLADERIFTDLRQVTEEDLNYLSLIIVRK